MAKPRLADTVTDIASAVAAAGHPDRSDWLLARADALKSGDASAVTEAKTELASIVHGMGGLLDIHFGADEPAIGSLIDPLWEEVRGLR